MDGWVVIGTKLDTKSFEKQIKEVEYELQQLDYELAHAKELKLDKRTIEEYTTRVEILTNKLIDLRSKQDKIDKQGFANIKGQIADMGNSMSNVIGKVARLGLAVFGVRSAYMAVRRAISLVASTHSEIQGQIDVMKMALANALLPVVQKILDFIAKIMVYINAIFKGITGKNLFDFDKAFKNANKNSSGISKNIGNANKKAKELSKTLAGFDEMNVLNDNTKASGSAGGGVGGGVGNIELKNPFEGWKDIKMPDWIEKVVWFGKWVIANWRDVIGLLLLIKLVIDLLTGNWLGVIVDIIGFIIVEMPVLVNAIGVMAKAMWEVIKLIGVTWVSIVKTSISVIVGLFTYIGNIMINPFVALYNTVVGVFNGIKTTVQGVFKIIKGLFTGDWKTVMNGFKQTFKGVFDTLWSIAKTPLNLIIGGLNALIKGANKIKIDVPSWVPGIGGKKFGFNIPQIPKLAKGGIVNMPGRGVPVGGALAGERGTEAVLPLTDSQQMALLGEAIGRYITINANITNTMNGRVISRELQKVQNETDFAYNR